MIPGREEAQRLLMEAESCNPGPWGDHCRNAATCARRIAEKVGMDAEKAYMLGLLHDIGRKFGKGHMQHAWFGFQYMMELGYDEVARICLTHSFPVQDFETFIGKRDISPEDQQMLQSILESIEYDDYDRLIQLCDGLAAPEGVVDVEERMLDVKCRYGSYPQAQWDAVMGLKTYFEEKCGKDIYEVVK